MNIGYKTIITALKSALMATSLLGLSLLGLVRPLTSDILPFISISYIVTFVLSMIGITITIAPFYSFSKTNLKDKIFERCFPYYAMLFFILCVILSLLIDFIVGSIILGIAYITAMFAWIWFFKSEKNEK